MRCAWAILLAVTTGGCAVLPKNIARPPSVARVAGPGSALGALTATAVAAHPGDSGFLLLNTGRTAIEARVALADAADSTIDAQYFIWAGDETGRVLIERVLAAADRGVRVRLLIDDYHTTGQDISFAVLDAHPNIEVRVFNPFARGRLRMTQFIGRWTELHHRMHNKMFLVDGRVAVVGGRNLTNEYFGLGGDFDFRDFDLLAIGAVVPDAATAFDRYWNSQWAYPITALHKPVSPSEYATERARFAARRERERGSYPYPLPRDRDESLAWLRQWQGRAVWAPAEVVYDDPSLMAKPVKGQVTAVGRRLVALTEGAHDEIVIENAYLVPHRELTLMRRTLQRGVRVQLLTNSLASTDVVLVNAGYAKVRPELATIGVALYEMKPLAASRRLYLAPTVATKAHLALHGKAAVFDGATVFLGSFNLDPRSAYLDTEAVFVVHSPELAAQVLDACAADFAPANAWHVGRVPGKGSAWVTERGDKVDVEPHEPASLWRRFKRSIGKLLPVRRYL